MKAKYGLLVSLLFILVLSGCGAKTIDMKEYAQVSFEGLDGKGTAQVNIHYESMEQEAFGGTDIEKGLKLETALDYKLSRSSDLSNGDTITVVYSMADTAAKDLNLKLTNTEQTITVEGLREAQSIDPFEEIKVTFSGTAPHGYVNIVNESENDFVKTISFFEKSDPSKGLSNGDTVVIEASYNPYSAEEYGYILTRETAEYTVEGLPSCITALSEIDDNTLQALETEAQGIVSHYFETTSGADVYNSLSLDYILSADEYDYGTPEVENVVLLTNKNQNSQFDSQLYVICKTPLKIHKPEGMVSGEVNLDGTYYSAVCFYQLIKNPDGSIASDPETAFFSEPGIEQRNMDVEKLYSALLNSSYMDLDIEYLNPQ